MATSVTSAGLKAASDKVIIASRGVVESLKLFSTDFSVDNAKKGSGVAVEVLAAVAGDFAANNGYSKASSTIKPATVTLNQHKKASYQVSDVDALENELSPVWSNLSPTAGKAVAKAAAIYALSLLDYTHRAAAITKNPSTYADFAELRGKVVENNLDPEDCTLVLTPAAYNTLIGVTPANIIGSDESARRAQLGEFLGFKAVIESPNCTKISGAASEGVTPQNGIGFVVPTGALAVAARVVAPIKAGGNLLEFGTIQDEETGFPFGTRIVVDADQGTLTWTVDTLFGAALTYNETTNPNAPRYLQIVSA